MIKFLLLLIFSAPVFSAPAQFSPKLWVNSSNPLSGTDYDNNTTGVANVANYSLSILTSQSPLISGTPTGILTSSSGVFTAQNTSLTAEQIYQPIIQAGYYFSDTIRSVVDIEPGSTVQNASAIAAYALSNTARGSAPNEANAVGLYSEVVVGADNGGAWGANFVCDDNKINGLATLTGRQCIGLEIDFQANGASTFEGIGLELQGAGTPANANGVHVSRSGGTARWTFGFLTDDAAAATGMQIGALSTSGTNILSQPINMATFNNSSAEHWLQLQAYPYGQYAALQIKDSAYSNGFILSSAPTGSSPTIALSGDFNENMVIAANGIGSVIFNNNIQLIPTSSSGANISSKAITFSTFNSSSAAHYTQIFGIPYGTSSAIEIKDSALANGFYLSSTSTGQSPTLGVVGDSNLSMTIGASGTGVVSIVSPLQLKSYTVATLPTCNTNNANSFLAVSDATSPTYNAAITGGGSVVIPVFCNGSTWTAH